jgi:dihydroxyacetone kinase-like predicted kinase
VGFDFDKPGVHGVKRIGGGLIVCNDRGLAKLHVHKTYPQKFLILVTRLDLQG